MTGPAFFFEQSVHSACSRAGNFSLLVQRKVTERKHVGAERAMGGTAQSFGEKTKEACTTLSSRAERLSGSLAIKDKRAKRRTFQSLADELHVEGFVALQGFGGRPPEARSFSCQDSGSLVLVSNEVTRPWPQAGRKLCPKSHSGRAS